MQLPLEMIRAVLSHFGYTEKCRLRCVCSLWCEMLDDLLKEVTWRDVEKDLNLQQRNDGGNGLYLWYLAPETTEMNVCRRYGQITIDISENDHLDLTSDEEMELAFSMLADEIGSRQVHLLRRLSGLFLKECFELYNEQYKGLVQLAFPQDLLPLILVKPSILGGLFIEFTPRSFLRYANGHKSIQDFKLSRDENGKWDGLGDVWETMTVRQILERFTPTRIETSGNVTFKTLSHNEDSNTISHLFEAIIFFAEQVRMKKSIPWH